MFHLQKHYILIYIFVFFEQEKIILHGENVDSIVVDKIVGFIDEDSVAIEESVVVDSWKVVVIIVVISYGVTSNSLSNA